MAWKILLFCCLSLLSLSKPWLNLFSQFFLPSPLTSVFSQSFLFLLLSHTPVFFSSLLVFLLYFLFLCLLHKASSLSLHVSYSMRFSAVAVIQSGYCLMYLLWLSGLTVLMSTCVVCLCLFILCIFFFNPHVAQYCSPLSSLSSFTLVLLFLSLKCHITWAHTHVYTHTHSQETETHNNTYILSKSLRWDKQTDADTHNSTHTHCGK